MAKRPGFFALIMYYPTGDRGGNEFYIMPGNRVTNVAFHSQALEIEGKRHANRLLTVFMSSLQRCERDML